MSYEIRTPVLARSAEIAERVAEMVIAGKMSSKAGAVAISGARGMQTAIKTEVEARLTKLRVAAAIRAAMWRGGLRGRSNAEKSGESDVSGTATLAAEPGTAIDRGGARKGARQR